MRCGPPPIYLGTQIEPHNDSDYRVWAQLGVAHVCVDPPGNPHDWSLDDLKHRREHVERFGLSLDMLPLPLASQPIKESQSPHVLLGRDQERQRELDSIRLLIDQIGAAGIPTAKYDLNIIGIPRTARSRAWRIASHGVSLAECGLRCRAGCSRRG